MGRTALTLAAPVTKGMSGILMIPAAESERRKVEPCIRCGACVDDCPMGLEPYLLATLSRLGHFDEAEEGKILNCIECGSCSYVCPASRPLLDYIRLGKSTVKKRMFARREQGTK